MIIPYFPGGSDNAKNNFFVRRFSRMKKIGYLIIAAFILSLCLAGLSMAGAEEAAGPFRRKTAVSCMYPASPMRFTPISKAAVKKTITACLPAYPVSAV